MDNLLSATLSNDYKTAAWIIIALTDTSDLGTRLWNLWILTFARLITGANKLHKALSLAFGRVATSLPCIRIRLDTLISLHHAYPPPISALLCARTTFVISHSDRIRNVRLIAATRDREDEHETTEQYCILHGRISS